MAFLDRAQEFDLDGAPAAADTRKTSRLVIDRREPRLGKIIRIRSREVTGRPSNENALTADDE